MRETLADRIMAALSRGGTYTVIDLHRRVGLATCKRSSVFSACLDLAEVGYIITSTGPRNGNGGVRLYTANPKKTYVPSTILGKGYHAAQLTAVLAGGKVPHKPKGRHIIPASTVASNVIDQSSTRRCSVVLYLVNGDYDVQPVTSRHGRAALAGHRGLVVGVYDDSVRPMDVIADILEVK